jgi:Protein of unknown function (DUF551)
MKWHDLHVQYAPVMERILVYVPIKHHRLVLAVLTREGEWLDENLEPMSFPPSHWMPLPSPPEEN